MLAALLESAPDDISPLSGIELVGRKAQALYTMGGNFVAFEPRYGIRESYAAEWNICQDIPAARLVTEQIPVPMIFAPYEIGSRVLSGKTFSEDSPAGMAIGLFFDKNREEFKGTYSRESWDPVTVCAAAGLDWFALSAPGRVWVDEEGKTHYLPGTGSHRYLIEKNPPEETAEKLESLYRTLEKRSDSVRRVL